MSPIFTFALSPDGPALTPQSDLWSEFIPGSRHDVGRPLKEHSPEGEMTYGDYFGAARDFLTRERCRLLCDTVEKVTGRAVVPEDVRRVSVYLVKYGAFYHPGYVVVEVGEHTLSFVLNVAVSPNGQRMIAREYQILSHLNTRFNVPYCPQVFGLGEGLGADGRPIPMFLGQWLEGYFEFHLSGDSADQRHVVVWDTQLGHFRLSEDQVLSCLGRAADILTQAYNPLTFEAIRHWHHAAGDFVVALDDREIGVRLITVRDYAPIMANPDPDVAAILDGLLIFLMEISLKLRLDRLDGIGRVVCHHHRVIPAICEGFFKGLSSMAPAFGLPEDFGSTVKEFIALHDIEQLECIASSVLKNTSAEGVERDLLQRKLKRHLSVFRNAVTP